MNLTSELGTGLPSLSWSGSPGLHLDPGSSFSPNHVVSQATALLSSSPGVVSFEAAPKASYVNPLTPPSPLPVTSLRPAPYAPSPPRPLGLRLTTPPPQIYAPFFGAMVRLPFPVSVQLRGLSLAREGAQGWKEQRASKKKRWTAWMGVHGLRKQSGGESVEGGC